MNLRAVEICLDQLLAALANGGVIKGGAGVEANVSRALEEVQIAERLALAGDASDIFEIGAHGSSRDR